jgi:glycosidase
VKALLLTMLLTGGSVLAESQDWPNRAVWYQIFPERFRNGDPKNDPTAEYSRVPEKIQALWGIIPWTKEWYALTPWEKDWARDVYGTNALRRYGGDFQGIIDKLSYLKDLGITAIYLNPVFESSSLHKYDARSFHHADPHFGPDPEGDKALISGETADPATWKWTAADKLFLELVRQSHTCGIRVILDGVFNHCATDFFAFADLKKNQEKSPYTHWFHVKKFDDPATPANEFDYDGWWGVKSMPEFSELTDNQGRKNLHPEVKAYLFAITRRWMDPDGDGDPSDGVDGWRLDVANEVGTGFWQDWNSYVRSLNPSAYTAPEIWTENSADFVREGKFDGVMNYYSFSMPVKGGLIDGVLPVREFLRLIEERRNRFPRETCARVQNLFDSHDTARMATMIVNRNRPYDSSAQDFSFDTDVHAGTHDRPYLAKKPDADDRKLQRMLVLFQMVYPGAPYLYYGTEAGMWGADDPDDRMPMVWEDLKFEPQTLSPGGQPKRNDDVNFDASLHAFYRECIALRKRHPALVAGEFALVGADNRTRTFALARTGEETLVAVFNRSESTQAFKLNLSTTDGSAPKPLNPVFISSGALTDCRVRQEPGKVEVTLPGMAGALLRQD